MSHTILISNWLRTRKYSQFKQASKQLFFSSWSRSTSHFYALIGQNLTDEFMRKSYAASWNLFTLTAEADRVLCQLVMFFNCLFLLDVQNEMQLLSRVFCYSWLVCLLGFGWEMRRLSKFGNSISDGIVFVFHLAWCVRVEKSEVILALLDTFQELHLEASVIIVFDVCFFISNVVKSSVSCGYVVYARL